MKIPVQLIGKRSTRHAVIQTEQEVENAKNRQEVQRAPRLRLTLGYKPGIFYCPVHAGVVSLNGGQNEDSGAVNRQEINKACSNPD